MKTQVLPQEPLNLGLSFIQEGSLYLDVPGAASLRLSESLGDLSLYWNAHPIRPLCGHGYLKDAFQLISIYYYRSCDQWALYLNTDLQISYIPLSLP